MPPLRILIAGAKGRMGLALQSCARDVPELEITAAIDVGDDPAPAVPGVDVVIDFSEPGATLGLIDLCARHGKPAVIGTTGHHDAQREEIRRRASVIPLVWSANFSTGVNALLWLTRRAAEILGPGFDLEIVEMHHRHKQDAPSGTARALADVLAEVRRVTLTEAARHGRSGLVGPRTSGEIGIHAVRGGDVVGDHTVLFAAPGERLELTHRASSRDTFARGALRAARWVVGRPPGLYSMQQVLGLA